MSEQRVIGSRIRDKRLDQGLRQADVAKAVGISASYLNLIEHNKRRIGGKLLGALAQVLEAEVAALASGADAGVLDGMRAAAARVATPVELARAEDLAARYPGWADLIAKQEGRLDALEDEVRMLTDRIANDPALAGALHNVITAVTSIRATAGILVSDDKIDADWQRRFHTNLRDDSRRLADESKALVAYLENPKEDDGKPRIESGFDAAETFLATNPAILTQLDEDPAQSISTLLDGYAPPVLAEATRPLVAAKLAQYATDAARLPLAAFSEAAIACAGDPAELAHGFEADLPSIFRRLAYLPDAIGLPPMGLVVCDGAGVITALKATHGVTLNRRHANCPLWPVFTALHHPERPCHAEVVLPDANATRFMCYAIATGPRARDFDGPSLLESTMLFVADPPPGTTPPRAVGTSCRICPRPGCQARREPSVVAAQ